MLSANFELTLQIKSYIKKQKNDSLVVELKNIQLPFREICGYITMSDINVLPVGLSKECVTDVLVAELGNVKVINIDVSAGSKPGDHNLSDVQRINVNYKNGNEVGNKTFIVKEIRKNTSDFVKVIKAVEKENSWYEFVLPEINKLKIDVGGNCYKKYEEWLLLEDLTPLGYKVVDRKKLLDLDHCLEALKALAKFHAVTHYLYLLNKLPEISIKNTQFTKENGALMYLRLKNFDDIIDNLTDMGVKKYNEMIKDLKPVAWDKMVNCLQQDFEFLCLVHGDFWTTNMLFKYDENYKVSDAKIIDFQLIRLSTPAFDIHFFISTSIQPKVRDNHLNEILKTYLETLNSTLKLLGCNSRITNEQFNRMLEDTKYIGLYSTMTFLPIVLCESPLVFQPPQDLPEEKKKYYTPFIEVFKQKTYRNHLVSMLDYYKNLNCI